MGSLILKEVLNRLQMYGNGYSMALVLNHRSTDTSLIGDWLLGLPLSVIWQRALVQLFPRASPYNFYQENPTNEFLIMLSRDL